MKRISAFIFTLLTILAVKNSSAQTCSEGSASSVKNHKIYLYFPTVDDNTFPEFGTTQGAGATSPLKAFKVSDLDAGIGTTDDLINRILAIVQEDYCEFDVQVVSTKTKPAPTEAQWEVVGIGSDNDAVSSLFGIAQNVDVNNAIAQDNARVWAGTYLAAYGATGFSEPNKLAGANSTLERWANSIGGTATHEAGHNYGLAHSTVLRPEEDAMPNHIMPAGSNVDAEHRANNRHFSDESYEILGHNIGLNTFTVINWDFINPNAEDAFSCVITVLSHAASLSFSRVYTGHLTPWAGAAIAASGTATYQGDSYNKFLVTFSGAHAWDGPTPGVVAGGSPFHVGVSFNEPDPVIVFETRVRDNSGTNLSLHPRVPSFDAGTADMATGDFAMRMDNAEAGAGDLQIANLQVFYLPRLGAIENMVPGDTLRDNQGFIVNLRNPSKSFQMQREMQLKDKLSINLARYTDPRTVDLTYDSTGCKRGAKKMKSGTGDGLITDLEYCPHGNALSMFPSTYVYVVATVVDPNAKHYDKVQGKMVTGPVTSQVFYQFAGKVPDFNHNGIDDLIDIRTKTSVDENNNGIPDDGEKTPPPPPHGQGVPCWLIIVIVIILIIIIIIIIIRRKKKTS